MIHCCTVLQLRTYQQLKQRPIVLPNLYTLTSIPLAQARAHRLMDALERLETPIANAVSMNEIDEAAGWWQVVAYYQEMPDTAAHAGVLARTGLTEGMLSLALLPPTDWVAASLEGLKPVTAGRFYVHGGHHQNRPPGGVALHIDAGTAFGTGHHGTTRGCLTALDSILKARRPRRVLDIGCGTGVLAIAAARAARCRTTASDIDPQATRVAAANARRNRVSALVQVLTASGTNDRRILGNAPYDLIFANILARPLISLAASIEPLASPGSSIVLSGLTNSQENGVLSAYRNRGLVLHRRFRKENWSTLWLKHR